MTLWLLRPVENLPIYDDPWDPWFDKAFGFVILAETETDARAFADKNAGEENRGEFLGRKISNTNNPWLTAKYSTCVRLDSITTPGIIIRDFASA
jgi:hypothetical protein